jgi:hypothetical protein
MFISKKHLPRRSFLRGAVGTIVSLPFLDAMIPALSAMPAEKARPFRFGAIYVPNGIYPQLWHPDKVGSDFEFKPIMKPLEPYRNYLVTVSKMKAPDGNADMGGVHMGASAAWLNGTGPVAKLRSYTQIESRKTIDQFIADKVAEDTPLRSLQVGTEDMGTSAGACDGYPCVFFNTVSWRDDTSPLPMGINPRVTFERMFGETGTAKQRLTNLKRKQSMLDSIAQETSKLQRSLARPITRSSMNTSPTSATWSNNWIAWNLVPAPFRMARARRSAIPDTFDEHMTVTYDLMRLAFQGDISRVFTFMVGHEGSSRSYAHIGIPEPHHPVSHHGDKPENIEKYAKLTTYHAAKLAEFIGKLKDTADGDGTLLDRSLIYFGSGMSNGNAHDRNNPPCAVIGGANGKLKGNRHISVDNKEPTANLLLAFADLAGAEVPEIGKSTGHLSL